MSADLKSESIPVVHTTSFSTIVKYHPTSQVWLSKYQHSEQQELSAHNITQIEAASTFRASASGVESPVNSTTFLFIFPRNERSDADVYHVSTLRAS